MSFRLLRLNKAKRELLEELERTGLKAVKEVLNWVGGWPTLEGSRFVF